KWPERWTFHSVYLSTPPLLRLASLRFQQLSWDLNLRRNLLLLYDKRLHAGAYYRLMYRHNHIKKPGNLPGFFLLTFVPYLYDLDSFFLSRKIFINNLQR